MIYMYDFLKRYECIGQELKEYAFSFSISQEKCDKQSFLSLQAFEEQEFNTEEG